MTEKTHNQRIMDAARAVAIEGAVTNEDVDRMMKAAGIPEVEILTSNHIPRIAQMIENDEDFKALTGYMAEQSRGAAMLISSEMVGLGFVGVPEAERNDKEYVGVLREVLTNDFIINFATLVAGVMLASYKMGEADLLLKKKEQADG